jgi:hypothetical protein
LLFFSLMQNRDNRDGSRYALCRVQFIETCPDANPSVSRSLSLSSWRWITDSIQKDGEVGVDGRNRSRERSDCGSESSGTLPGDPEFTLARKEATQERRSRNS